MRNIKKLLILIIIVFPIIIKADTYNYNNSTNIADGYIFSFENYESYIMFPKQGYYFNESSKEDNELFKKGGFLSLGEYKITNSNSKSYLSPGLEYWTLTQGSSNTRRYTIAYKESEKNKTESSGVRVTEFIKPRTRVTGKGTFSDPFILSPINKVILISSDPKKGQISETIGDCSDKKESVVFSVSEGDIYTAQLCPSNGYEFLGSECSNIKKSDGNTVNISEVNKNISCRINFIVIAHKITLDTNGGSAISTKELYLAPNRNWFLKYEDRADESKAITKISGLPTKTGYSFNGFYTTKTDGTKIIDTTGNIVSKTGYGAPGTMYARYTANSYTVTLNNQGGTGSTANVTATFDSSMPKVTPPTRTGYTFDGYYSGTNGTGTKYYNSDGSSAANWNVANNTTTIYAKWVANKYTITLDRQGGTGGSSSVSATYNAGMPAMTKPARTGYTFNGYYSGTNGTGTKYYNADGTSARTWNVANNTKLYAYWTANKYTVTLDRQGGTGGSSSVSATYNAGMPAMTKPARTGYTFNGYYSGTNGTGTQYYKADGTSAINWNKTANTTLYAKWKESIVVLTYNDIYNGTKCANFNTSLTNPKIEYSGNCKVEQDGGTNWKIKFLTSGTIKFNVQTYLDLFLLGGGGGGGGGAWDGSSCHGGGGGGAGKTSTTSNILVEQKTYSIVVGKGGSGGPISSESRGGAGGSSSFGTYTVAGGTGAIRAHGANGGSGGGAFGADSNWYQNAPAAGRNGGNGGATVGYAGGTGQGTTTKEYSSGTQYSGGGGGGSLCSLGYCYSPATGYDGAGSGGQSANGKAATANTGGGGGGGGCYAYSYSSGGGNAGGAGGSGLVVIRNKR